MKKHLALACVLASTLALAACSTPSTPPAANPTSRVTKVTAASDVKSPDTFPKFAPKTFKGSGDGIIALPASAALLTYSTKAEANYAGFTVDLLNASNKDTGVLFTTYDDKAVKGTTSVGITNVITGDDDPDDVATRLRIKSGTKWTITLHPVSDVKVGMPSDGTGDDVFYVERPVEDANVSVKHTSLFQVTAVNAKTGENTSLLNETSGYSGVVPFENVRQYLVIQTAGTGSWSVK